MFSTPQQHAYAGVAYSACIIPLCGIFNSKQQKTYQGIIGTQEPNPVGSTTTTIIGPSIMDPAAEPNKWTYAFFTL